MSKAFHFIFDCYESSERVSLSKENEVSETSRRPSDYLGTKWTPSGLHLQTRSEVKLKGEEKWN